MNIMLSRLILLVIYLQRIIEETMQRNTDFGVCNCSCICIVSNHKIQQSEVEIIIQIDRNRLVIRGNTFVVLTIYVYSQGLLRPPVEHTASSNIQTHYSCSPTYLPNLQMIIWRSKICLQSHVYHIHTTVYVNQALTTQGSIPSKES